MSDVVVSQLRDTGVVAIIRGIDGKHMAAVAQALYEGSVRLVEVTLNTDGALDAIESLRSQFGDRMSIGAGTVLNREAALAARDSGAQFFVTPNVDQRVIDIGVSAGMPVMTGAMTPTEIYTAHQAGASFVKVFPAGTLGARYIKEVRGPLSHIPLMAVGGVSLDNAREFLDAGAVAFGLGSSLVDRTAVDRGDYAVIARRAQAFVGLYQGWMEHNDGLGQ